MRKFSLVEFSVKHPKLVVILSIIITLAFMTQFPKMKTDTNLNTCSPTHPMSGYGKSPGMDIMKKIENTPTNQADRLMLFLV